MSSELEEELRERLHTRRLDKLTAAFSGACISKGHAYSLDDGSRVFVKTNGGLNARAMFEGELESLRQINATKTVRAPRGRNVIHNYDNKQNSALVVEFLDIASLDRESARTLGQDLARLHDYNNKVIRFQAKASKWVGSKIPSTKQSLKLKADAKRAAEASAESETDDNRAHRWPGHRQTNSLQNDEQEEEEEGEENQFSKHSLRGRNANEPNMPRDATSGPETLEADADGAPPPERFVPEPGTDRVDEFGFDVPTSCGSIPQLNAWTRDWVSFYARHRLDHTIRMILSDHSDRELNEQWSRLQVKVDKFFADFEHRGAREGEIVPALLHGDLWSGNVAQLSGPNGRGVVYDPASFYGHAEYEFGIVRMFGGIPSELERAYFEELPKAKMFEQRNKLYQLFHHLNHWNHFGSGYRSSSLAILKSLNAAV